MGKKCKVCGMSYSSTGWLTFHKFPSNARLLKMWCDALNLDSETLPKFSYVCSLHFSPSDITMVAGRAQILLNAVPFNTRVHGLHINFYLVPHMEQNIRKLQISEL